MIVRFPLSPSIALTHFDEPWVVTATRRRTLVSRRSIRFAPRREVPRHPVDPDTVDPALQHRRLTRPPRRVDEHERVAPQEIVDVSLERRVGPGLEVPSMIGLGERRIEPVGVQVVDPNLGAL